MMPADLSLRTVYVFSQPVTVTATARSPEPPTPHWRPWYCWSETAVDQDRSVRLECRAHPVPAGHHRAGRTRSPTQAGQYSPAAGDLSGGQARHGRYMRHGEISQRVEYRVLELRESRIGGALSGDKLEEILNDEARQGWVLKSITHADVKGRIGPGAVEGLLLTFERPVG